MPVATSLSAPEHRETRGIGLLIDELVPAPWNPRRSFDDAAQGELVASIRAHGILTPLLVRPLPYAKDEAPTYEVVAGARRLRAADTLGLESVPCTVRPMTDDEAREAAIVENLQREDLGALDEAHAYQQLLSRSGAELVTVETIAAKVGKGTAYVHRRLKLLALIPEVQEPLAQGRLTLAHAELLAKLTAADQARALTDAVWLPLYDQVESHEGDTTAYTAQFLQPLTTLREWIDRHTTLNTAGLASDPESRALFPEAAAAIYELGQEDAPLEVALHHFGDRMLSAPEGVLVPDKHFREVTGKRCAHAERAIVVFGRRRGDVVDVCRAKKTCKTHWPPKAKVDKAEQAGAPPRQSWQDQEAERKRRQTIWERIRPDAIKAVVEATKKISSTPKLLREILTNHMTDVSVDLAIKAVGTLNPLTFGRVFTIAETIMGLYGPDHSQTTLTRVGAKFDVAKAMKAAEATAAPPEPPKNPNKKAIKKALDRVRAKNAKRGRSR